MSSKNTSNIANSKGLGRLLSRDTEVHTALLVSKRGHGNVIGMSVDACCRGIISRGAKTMGPTAESWYSVATSIRTSVHGFATCGHALVGAILKSIGFCQGALNVLSIVVLVVVNIAVDGVSLHLFS